MAERNDVIIEAWNTVLFDKFCRFKHLLVESLVGHSDEALARHSPRRGARKGQVIDALRDALGAHARPNGVWRRRVHGS